MGISSRVRAGSRCAGWLVCVTAAAIALTSCSSAGTVAATVPSGSPTMTSSSAEATTPAPSSDVAAVQAGSQPIPTIASDVPMMGLDEVTSMLREQEATPYPVYAVRASYAQLTSYSPAFDRDTRIAPDAPMWALTFHETFVSGAGALSGTRSKTWDVYTVVQDGVTGDFVTSGMGVDLEALGVPGDLIVKSDQ